jgi:DNA-directed RNA polymerase alpha subunit
MSAQSYDETPYDAEGDLYKLELPYRCAKALWKAGIKTISDMKLMSDKELLSIPNLGRKSLLDIKECLLIWDNRVNL